MLQFCSYNYGNGGLEFFYFSRRERKGCWLVRFFPFPPPFWVGSKMDVGWLVGGSKKEKRGRGKKETGISCKKLRQNKRLLHCDVNLENLFLSSSSVGKMLFRRIFPQGTMGKRSEHEQ